MYIFRRDSTSSLCSRQASIGFNIASSGYRKKAGLSNSPYLKEKLNRTLRNLNAKGTLSLPTIGNC
jgi:hypothetical protein